MARHASGGNLRLLDERDRLRRVHAVHHANPTQAAALLLCGDVGSARHGILRLYGKGENIEQRV